MKSEEEIKRFLDASKAVYKDFFKAIDVETKTILRAKIETLQWILEDNNQKEIK